MIVNVLKKELIFLKEKKKKLALKIARLKLLKEEYLISDKLFIEEKLFLKDKTNKLVLIFNYKSHPKYTELKEEYRQLKSKMKILSSFNEAIKTFDKITLNKFKKFILTYRIGLVTNDNLIIVSTTYQIIEGIINLVLKYDSKSHEHISFADRWNIVLKENEKHFNCINEYQKKILVNYYRDPRSKISHGDVHFLDDESVLTNITPILHALLGINYSILSGSKNQTLLDNARNKNKYNTSKKVN